METCLRKVVRLKGSDGEEMEVEEAVASQLQVVKHMIEDGCADDVIFLPNVTGRTLSLVIQYCNKHHLNNDDDAYDLENWDAHFVNVDQDILFNLIMAANYLDIKSLLDLVCQKVANMIRGKQPEEIRKMFNIKNDFTPEEEEELRRRNAWAFDD